MTLVDSFDKNLLKSDEKLNQNEVNHLILNFIVEEMLPVSIVDKESLKTLAERLLSVRNNSFKILCRKSYMQLLIKEYTVIKSNLIK